MGVHLHTNIFHRFERVYTPKRIGRSENPCGAVIKLHRMELRSITLCSLFQNVNFDTVDPQRVRVIGHLDLIGPLFLNA